MIPCPCPSWIPLWSGLHPSCGSLPVGSASPVSSCLQLVSCGSSYLILQSYKTRRVYPQMGAAQSEAHQDLRVDSLIWLGMSTWWSWSSAVWLLSGVWRRVVVDYVVCFGWRCWWLGCVMLDVSSLWHQGWACLRLIHSPRPVAGGWAGANLDGGGLICSWIWARLNIKTVFPGMGISIIKIRRLWDCLIFVIGILYW